MQNWCIQFLVISGFCHLFLTSFVLELVSLNVGGLVHDVGNVLKLFTAYCQLWAVAPIFSKILVNALNKIAPSSKKLDCRPYTHQHVKVPRFSSSIFNLVKH